jgi:hypothetical protein
MLKGEIEENFDKKNKSQLGLIIQTHDLDNETEITI